MPVKTEKLPEKIIFSRSRSEKTAVVSREELTIAEFCELLTDHQEGPKKGACWLPAEFSGTQRSNAAVQRIMVAVLDIDGGMSVSDAIKRIEAAGYGAIIHTTWSHTNAAHRFRIILFASRPWDPSSFPNRVEAVRAYKEGLLKIGEQLGLKVDYGSLDPAHCFFLPRHPSGEQHFTNFIDGSPMRVWDPADIPSHGEDDEEGTSRGSRSIPPEIILAALSALPNDQRFNDRQEWIKILAAIKHELGNDGFEPAEQWSAKWTEGVHNSDEFARAWESLGNYSGRKASAATILSAARAAGWRDPRDYKRFTTPGAAFDDLGEEEKTEAQNDKKSRDPFEDAGHSSKQSHETKGDDEAKSEPPGQDNLKFSILTPEDCLSDKPAEYVIKGLVNRQDVVTVVGAPGVGKSAWAAAIGYEVARGNRSFGMRTRRGPVLYIACENERDMKKRVRALREHRGPASGFGLVLGGGGKLGDQVFIKWLVMKIKRRRPVLIVIDTLSAGMGAFEENSSEGMGKAIGIARSLTEWGAAVLVVHHDTKAKDGLPRGHSSLNGIVDANLALSRAENGEIYGRCSKNRNGPSNINIVAYRNRVVSFGRDEDGDPMTTVICDELDFKEGGSSEERPNQTERIILLLLRDAIRSKGVDVNGRRGVIHAVFRDICLKSVELSASDNPESRKRIFNRALKDLRSKNLIESDETHYFLPKNSSDRKFADVEEEVSLDDPDFI